MDVADVCEEYVTFLTVEILGNEEEWNWEYEDYADEYYSKYLEKIYQETIVKHIEKMLACEKCKKW